MSRVLLIGEPMILFIAQTEEKLEDVRNFTRSISGAEINVAIGVQRLGHEATYVTRLGDDPFGSGIVKFLMNEKIDTSLIERDEVNRTGFQHKAKTSKGDPEICYFRKGSAASKITSARIDEIPLDHFDHLHLTGIFPALSDSTREASFKLIGSAREKGLSITFDPNLRPTLWKSEADMVETVNALAAQADIVLPGIHEGGILTGSEDEKKIADFYLSRGAKAVVVKLGKEGAYWQTAEKSEYSPAFLCEKRVDTVGAGDGFAVGVITSLLEGMTLAQAVERGNAIGTMQIMSPYDNEDLPDREKLKAFMETHRP